MGVHRKSPVVTPVRVLAVSAAVGTTLTAIQSTSPEPVPEIPVEAAPVTSVAFPGVMSVAPDPVVKIKEKPTTYIVVDGDTLSKIAVRVGQSMSDLQGRNRSRVADPDVVRVGQVLSLAGSVQPAPVPSPARTEVKSSTGRHAVKKETEVKSEERSSEAPTSARGVSAIPAIAKTFTGVRYVYGGKTRASGLDCSGFVYNVLKQAGLSNTYRTSGDLRSWTTRISKSEARAGDLVFGPGHVGIYLGDGMMIDAPRPGKTIQVRKVYSAMNTYGRIAA